MDMFKKATKEKAKLRLAIAGPSGSGKTYSALQLAKYLAPTGKIALIDTEHSSASKYADLFEFDTCALEQFHPTKYIECIRAAGQAGYEVIIIDSLTHAWYAELEMAGGNFQNWAKVRPLERALIEAMLSSPAHIIGTMRSKTEYVVTQKTNKQGNMVSSPEKVGTAPIQASGIEYEFDVAGEMALDNILTITKSRCPQLSSTTHLQPGKNLANTLLAWLDQGVEPIKFEAAAPIGVEPMFPAFNTAPILGARVQKITDMTMDELFLGEEPTPLVKPAPSDAKTAPAPTQSIEEMTIDQLYVEFKARCKTNGVKASEKFKELMGAQLQDGVTFADLDSDKARWLVLELPLF